jgi:hypothetical protein
MAFKRMFLVAAVALAWAPCGCSQQPIQGGYACPAIIEELTPLYYPSPGATGVPVNLGEIIVGQPHDGSFSLAAAGAPPGHLGPPHPVPSPAPTSLPAYDSPASFAAISLPVLATGTTYMIAYTPPKATGPCGSEESSGTIGTFTTVPATAK